MVEQIGQRTAHHLIGQPRSQHSAGLVASDQVITLESPKRIHIDNYDAGNIPTPQKVASRRRQWLSLGSSQESLQETTGTSHAVKNGRCGFP
jgi:hypothetical protein